jgi:hypothetical protein
MLTCALLLVADDPQGRLAPPTPAELLQTVVARSLLLADEEDPLRRANHCTEVADSLARAITQASARGQTDEALRLSRYLGQLMDRGVVRNTVVASPEEEDGRRLAEWAQASWRAGLISATLERELQEHALPSVPVKQIVEDSRKGWEHAWEKGKGKGKGKDFYKEWERELKHFLKWDKGKGKGKGKDPYKEWEKYLKDLFKGEKGKGKGKVPYLEFEKKLKDLLKGEKGKGKGKGKGKEWHDPFNLEGGWHDHKKKPDKGKKHGHEKAEVGAVPRDWRCALPCAPRPVAARRRDC